MPIQQKTKKRKPRSEEHRQHMREIQRGEGNSNWKGNKATYWAMHKWLVRNYGPANKCSNKNCQTGCTRYQWALLKGKKHDHNVKNYKMLCEACHKLYDRRPCAEETKLKISIAQKKVWLIRKQNC